ncbi:MAG: hypothetical protein RL069_188 [Planctomycetota bacterium]|jgi:hypothetical protein
MEFPQQGRESLEQDLLGRVLDSLSKFASEVGYRNKFVTAVVERYLANILRDKTADKRDHCRIEPRYRNFGMEVPSLTVKQFWTQVTDFGIDEVDLIKLDCEVAEYLIISDLSALGLMNRIGWIRSEWHSRKGNLLFANLLGHTYVFNIDPNYPHSVGMFVAHRL